MLAQSLKFFLIICCSAFRLAAQAPPFSWSIANIGVEGNTAFVDMEVDSDDNIIGLGEIWGTVYFGPQVEYLSSELGQFGLSTKDFFIEKLDSNGNVIWLQAMDGWGNEYPKALTVDENLNIYVFGEFFSPFDCDPSDEEFMLLPQFENSSDLFLIKYNSEGEFKWALSIGGWLSDKASDILYDDAGSIYLTGSIEGTADLDPGISQYYPSNNYGGKNVFVEKLDTSGNFIWGNVFGSNAADNGFSLANDSEQNIYLCGEFSGSANLLGPINVSSNGQTDGFVLKLDNAGNFKWQRAFGGVSFDYAKGLTVDENENLFVSGVYNGFVDFDDGPDQYYMNSWGKDLFILSFDTSGNILSGESFSGPGVPYPNSIESNGNRQYLVGFTEGDTDFGNGLLNAGNSFWCGFILAFNASIQAVWSGLIPSESSSKIGSVKEDSKGNIYLAGEFVEQSDLDPGATTYLKPSSGSFITRLGFQTNHVPWDAPLEFDDPFWIYPNPTTDILNLYLNESFENILLFDGFGKIIHNYKSIEESFAIDLVDSPTGVYFLQLSKKSDTFFTRIVKY